MLFMVFYLLAFFLYHMLVCGLSITLRYTGPVVFNSAGRLSKYFFKDVRAQKFPRTDFFKTLSAGRK